jgi:hypothetical protein
MQVDEVRVSLRVSKCIDAEEVRLCCCARCDHTVRVQVTLAKLLVDGELQQVRNWLSLQNFFVDAWQVSVHVSPERYGNVMRVVTALQVRARMCACMVQCMCVCVWSRSQAITPKIIVNERVPRISGIGMFCACIYRRIDLDECRHGCTDCVVVVNIIDIDVAAPPVDAGSSAEVCVKERVNGARTWHDTRACWRETRAPPPLDVDVDNVACWCAQRRTERIDVNDIDSSGSGERIEAKDESQATWWVGWREDAHGMTRSMQCTNWYSYRRALSSTTTTMTAARRASRRDRVRLSRPRSCW